MKVNFSFDFLESPNVLWHENVDFKQFSTKWTTELFSMQSSIFKKVPTVDVDRFTFTAILVMKLATKP
jgi:hypothetical protein